MTSIINEQLSEMSAQTLFQEAKRRAIDEGVSSFDEYRDLVENLIQEKLNEGMYDASEDLPTLEKDLEMMWPEVEKSLW